MTAMVTEATVAAITTTPYETFSATVGACTILLLLVFLVEKELLRAFRGSRSAPDTGTFDHAIVPLLCACGLIIAVRLLTLIQGQ